MEPTRKRRWWQFGLRWLFAAMLVVAAYLAGRLHGRLEMQREMQAEFWRRVADPYALPDDR